LTERRRKVITHPYGEKPPIIRLLPNGRYWFAFRTQSIVPNFIIIALTVFGWPDP